MAQFVLSSIKPAIKRYNHLVFGRYHLCTYSDTRTLCGGPIEVPEDTELVRDLSIIDSRIFVFSETTRNSIKPTSTQILTFNELFDPHNSAYYKHREMYQHKLFDNFQEISYFDMMRFGDCSFFIRSEYRPLDNVNGDALKHYIKSQEGHREESVIQKVGTAGTGCFVTRNEHIDELIDTSSRFIITAAHTIASHCDYKLNKIHDPNNTDIAGELEAISILTRGPNQQFIGNAKVVYLDPDHDIAILRCSQINPCSMRIADFDINTEVPIMTEIMNAGYQYELKTVDSTGSVIDNQRIINVFGKVGELSFSSLNQNYVDNNVDIKENQLLYSQNKKIANSKKSGKLEIYSPILKAQYGGGASIKPREIIGIVVEDESLSAKYNHVQIITDEAKEMLQRLENDQNTQSFKSK